MGLIKLYPVRYAQTEGAPAPEKSLTQQWAEQQLAEEQAAEQAAQRHRYRTLPPGPVERGVKLRYKPLEEGEGPGELDYMSFPIVEVGDLIGDPTKLPMQITEVETGPAIQSQRGAESLDQIEAANALKEMGFDPHIIGEGDIPDGYEIIVPDPVDFFASSKAGGKAGWLADVYSGAQKRSEHKLYAFAHPTYLPVEKLQFVPDDMRTLQSLGKGTAVMAYYFMNMMNQYLAAGEHLRNNPEEDDIEYLKNNFWIPQLSVKTNDGKPFYIDPEDPLGNKNTVYGYLYQYGIKSARQLSADYGYNANEDDVDDAVTMGINNAIRKFLSGYYNKYGSKQVREDKNLMGTFLVAYLKNSVKKDVQKALSKKMHSKESFESESLYTNINRDSDDTRGLEDTISGDDDVAQDAIDNIMEDYDEVLSEDDDEDNSSANEIVKINTNLNNLQHAGRLIILSGIEEEAEEVGVNGLLDQWNQQFRDFLINHETYTVEHVSKTFNKLLPLIDFNAGILPKGVFPCSECGEGLILSENGELEPAVVPADKGKDFVCRSCGATTTRPDNLSNALTIPLLAFLETKKREILKDERFGNLEHRAEMAQNIDKLMGLNYLRIILRGPSRYGKSVPGREPILIYRNGKMFLKHSRTKNPDIAKLLSFSELNEMPVAHFLAGQGWPIGGAFAGYDRRVDERYTPPFGTGKADLSQTPGAPYERNTMLEAVMLNELLPMLVQDPTMQQQLGQLTPVELSDTANIRKNVKIWHVAKNVMKDVTQALENIRQRASVKAQGQPFQSYEEILAVAGEQLVNETAYHLSRKYPSLIPNATFPDSQEEIKHLIIRAAEVLDSIASVKDANINNLSVNQLISEDPSARTDPRYHIAENYGQFLDPDQAKRKPKPLEHGDYARTIEDFEGETAKLQANEAQIDKVVSFISDHEAQFKNSGVSLPQDPSDAAAKEQLENFLIEQGILDMGIDEATLESAVHRIAVRYDNTKNLYETFQIGDWPKETQMVDLSSLLSGKAKDAVFQALIEKRGKPVSMPTAYAAVEASPATKMLYYITHSDANFSISDFMQMLLVSASGMFGIAENYTPEETSFAVDPETQEPIRFAPVTEDAISKQKGKGQSLPFDAAYQQAYQGEREQEFPIGHPRAINMPRTVDPYTQEPKKDLYMLFADQFSPQAIAENPRYAKYMEALSQSEYFQGLEPVEIVKALRQEVVNIVETFYKDPESALFKNDPITSMKAIASFFIPADLMDACSDAWAKEVASTPYAQRQKGLIQNSSYRAASILFDIKDATESGETNENMIIDGLIAKYKLADPENPDWVEHVRTLLSSIIQDIQTQQGCASRALDALESRDNLRYLSSTYNPTKRDYFNMAQANILRDINTLIRLAYNRVSDLDIYENIQNLEGMVKEAMYETV